MLIYRSVVPLTLLRRSGYLVACMLLAACQHTPTLPQLPPVTQQPNSTASPNHVQFQITGKIGVRTPKQNGSAFYVWQQQQDAFAIELTGAMGIGRTVIQGNAQHAQLESSKTGLITADNPEELLYKATGWVAPITHLTDWTRGQAATADAHTQADEQTRLTQIGEDGWQVQLNYQDNERYPNKLTMLDAENGNRVILTIQTRQ